MALTLKQWADLLPHNVTCTVVDMGKEKESVLCGVYSDCELVFHDTVESHQGFESTKPHLRPLSSVTKLITVDGYNGGNPFVPIGVLHRRHCKRNNIKVSEYEVNDLGSRIFTSFRNHQTGVTVDLSNHKDMDYWIVEQLQQWHFAIGISEEDYIKIED